MEEKGGMMAATPQRRSRTASTFRPDDFVSARQYDRDWDDLKNMMQDIQKSIKELVPREEHERIWQANENRFSRLETKLDLSFDEVAKGYTPRREFEDQLRQSRDDRQKLTNDHKDLQRQFDALNNRTAGRFLANSNQSTYYLITIGAAVIGALLGHIVH